MGRAKQIAEIEDRPPPPDPGQGYTVGGPEGNIPDEDVSQETIDRLGSGPSGVAGWGFDQGSMYAPPEGPSYAFGPDTAFDLYEEEVGPTPTGPRPRSGGFWTNITEDGSGGFISPDEFFEKITSTGMWSTEEVREAAQSYARWYREVWGGEQDPGTGEGQRYAFEVDSWRLGWEDDVAGDSSPDSTTEVQSSFDGGANDGGAGQSGFNTEFVEGLQADIQRLEDLVTSWGTQVAAPVEDTSRNDQFQQLMMGLFYGGRNEPPANPYGFGTIYGGY